MPTYSPPLRDMQFVLHELLEVERTYKEMPAYREVDAAMINQVIEQAGRFASEVVAPLNQIGDREGCTRHEDGSVTTPRGFAQAYRQYAEAGWPSLACAAEHGGQGLPLTLNSVLYEMLNSANQAWTMYPGLSHGAYECLQAHGTEEQKRTYLEKLVDGSWLGTMCLTEPHCGTDLGLIRSTATPQPDGTYLISGTKIFISSGEHDLGRNIVHLVLARLPGAPAGTKGISLFVVPKFLPDAQGEPGTRNAVSCGSVEHKMGIHGNATCVMNFDNAIGTLVGERDRGLAAMFVMMNSARLGVGMQGVGLTEAAYQNAVRYARDRLQMRSLKGPAEPRLPADPIIVHPDVRRLLLTQKAWAEGARAFSYWVALLIDTELNHPDSGARKEAADLVALLTPIVKAFITDNAFSATNDGLQVFGGHGYIAEWGMEQYVRDARINTIYEGTNAIQSLDLLGRKVLSDMGAKLRKLGKIVKEFIEEEGVRKPMTEFIDPLADLAKTFEKLTMEIGMKAMTNRDEVGAAAVPYLRIAGHLVYAYLFARMAKIALAKKNSGDKFYEAKLATARFYFARLLPETAMHIAAIRTGSSSLMAMDASLF